MGLGWQRNSYSAATMTALIEMVPLWSWGELPDEVWLHIFSFLDYTSMNNCRLVCKRFYSIGTDSSLPELEPSWSLANVQKMKEKEFSKILKQRHISLYSLMSLSRTGIPLRYRNSVYQTLLGYLPLNSTSHSEYLLEKRRQYKELQQERLSVPTTEDQEEFYHFLDMDLPRIIVPNNIDLIGIVYRCLQLFNYQFPTPYLNSAFSLHFPLVLEAYFYWCFCISFHALKVQGGYTDGNRRDHSFILATQSKVDRIVNGIDPELTNHFLEQGICSSMYLHNWITSAFSHSFKIETVLRIWDSLLSDKDAPGISMELVIYLCAAIVLQNGTKLKKLETDEIITALVRDLSHSLKEEELDLAFGNAYLLRDDI